MPTHTTRDVRTGYAAMRLGGAPSTVFTGAGFDWDSSDNPQIIDTAGNTIGPFTPTQGIDQFMAASSGQRAWAFRRTVTITSAAAITPIDIITAAEAAALPTGAKPYITSMYGKVNGATAWATTATVKVQDKNASAVDFLTIAVAAMTANAVIFPSTANVTPENAYILGTGGTANKGLQVVGDANGTGSNFVLTVVGFYLL